MMKLDDVIQSLTDPDRVRICRDKEILYTGYRVYLAEGHLEKIGLTGDEEVKRLRAVPEIRHKNWKELGLMAPLEPKETPMYSFSDLQMQLYYTIYI